MSKEKSGNWFARHKILSAIGAVIVVLIIIGIVLSGSDNNGSTSTVSTTSSPKPKPEPKAKAKPSTVPRPAATKKSNQPHLNGIGETNSKWNNSHTADSQFTSGKAYDPMPNSIYGDSTNPNNTDKYVATVHQYGVITDYTIQLNRGVSQSQAQSIAMAEMPTDVTVLSSAVNPNGCYLIALHSSLLASDLAQNDSQNQGGIIIELDTISSSSLDYSASNVNSMDIRLAHYPSSTSSPICEG